MAASEGRVAPRWPAGRFRARLARLTERQIEVAFGAVLVLTVVLCLAVGEGLVRLRDALRDVEGFDWMALIAHMTPGTEATPARFVPHSVVGNVRINSRGFRGPELPATKSPDVLRIAFLGDSKLLNAELRDDETIAAVTARLLGSRYPGCRIEHVTVAGPVYTFTDLAHVVRADVSALHPDAYVVLAGSAREAVSLHARANPRAHHLAPYSPLTQYSTFWLKLSRAFHLAREARAEKRRAPVDPAVLTSIAQSLDASVKLLADATRPTPVVAIGYRGRTRPETEPQRLMADLREMRAFTLGLNVQDLARMSNHVVDALHGIADRHGWTFIDPIADIAPTAEHFVDLSHFTSRGVVHLSHEVAVTLASVLKERGLACASRARDPAAGRP